MTCEAKGSIMRFENVGNSSFELLREGMDAIWKKVVTHLTDIKHELPHCAKLTLILGVGYLGINSFQLVGRKLGSKKGSSQGTVPLFGPYPLQA